MLSRHFSVALACYGGDRRRGRGQTAQLALGRLSRPLLFGRLFPAIPHSATDPLAGFGRCRLFRVSDTRSKPLNQEDSIKGYPQQTRSGTQDRSRQGDRLGKRGRRHHPAQRHLFAHLSRRGPVEDHTQLRLQQPAHPRQARQPGAHTHRRAQRRGGPSCQLGRQRRSCVKRPHLPATGSPPSPFFGRPCRREDGTSAKNKRSPGRMFLQVLSIWDAPRKSGTAQSEAFFRLFSRNPRAARCCVDLARSRRIPNCSVTDGWTKTSGT